MSRGRRGRRIPPEKKCQRESCPRRKRQNQSFCGPICAWMFAQLEADKALIEQVGPGRLSGQLWSVSVELSDLLSQHFRLRRCLESVVAQMKASEVQASSLTADSSLSGSNLNQAFPPVFLEAQPSNPNQT